MLNSLDGACVYLACGSTDFEQLPNRNGKDAQALDFLLPWSPQIQEKFRVKPRCGR